MYGEQGQTVPHTGRKQQQDETSLSPTHKHNHQQLLTLNVCGLVGESVIFVQLEINALVSLAHVHSD